MDLRLSIIDVIIIYLFAVAKEKEKIIEIYKARALPALWRPFFLLQMRTFNAGTFIQKKEKNDYSIRKQ